MLKDNSKGWIYVFIQILLIALILIFSFRDLETTIRLKSIDNYIGLGLIIFGLMLMILVFITFNQIMTPNPIPLNSYSLNTKGIYKQIRHPMYAGALILLGGVVLYCKSISGFILFIIAIMFIINKIRFEEKMLNEKFSEYKLYSSKTKKLIPFIY